MTTLRWGILGTGGIAHQMAAELLLDGHPVTAVGSRTDASAQAFADEFGIAAAHGSYAALAADAEVDVIYVSSPHPGHAEHALLALEAGKHVLVEKPFTLTAAEADVVVTRAAELGLVALEAMWTRFLPGMERIHELLGDNRLGEVLGLIADHTQSLPTDPAHRLNDPALGGGALLDLGVYPVSFAIDLFGDPTDIAAVGTLGATGVDVQESIALGFEGGRTAAIQVSSIGAGPNMAVILGTEGRIEIDATWYGQARFRLLSPEGVMEEEFVPDSPGRGMYFQARELERLVGLGALAGDLLPPDESVRIMGVLDSIRAQLGVRYPQEG